MLSVRKQLLLPLLVFLVLFCTLITNIYITDSDKTHSIAASFHVRKDRDLLYLHPVTLDINYLKKAYFDKLEDLKRKHALKKFTKRRNCSKKISPNIACVDTSCRSALPPAMSDANFKSVFKPLTRVKDLSVRLAEALGPFRGYSEVIFVSGSSSNHYKESQALMKNMHEIVFPRIHNFTFYFYDLGLKPTQRQQMLKHCRCEVRKFPFHLLPRRFAFLKGFAWKILIMQAIIPHADISVWVDTSIRFLNTSLDTFFTEVRSSGLLLSTSTFTVGQLTSRTMFDYFDDPAACPYEPYYQMMAGLIAVHNEPFTRDIIFKTWFACAVDLKCMFTEYNKLQVICLNDIRMYYKCHRFDQAAISLILVKLFREYYLSFSVPLGKYHLVWQGHRSNYFSYLEAITRSTKPHQSG